MANKGQRMIFEDEYQYLKDLKENYPDPSDIGGSTYTAGEGIIIEDDTISVDNEDVAMVSNLSTVAFSGSYNDLSNKPTIPTATSDLTNDSGFIDNTYHDDSKLTKVTNATQVMQAYVKLDNGTNQMLDVHWNNSRDTIPIRDQTGNIRVAITPTINTHATSKQYVDNSIGYTHIVEATFVDGCDEEYTGRFIIKISSNTLLTVSTFKALFTYGSQYKQIPYVSTQEFDSDNYGIITSVYDYEPNEDKFRNSFAYYMGAYSSSLTLQSLTDTIL